MSIIQVENLTKIYKNGVRALDGLSLTVEEGEIFALLGKNGAGKSTLINVLTTFLPPSSGKILMLGHDIYHGAADIRKQISCVAQKPSIDLYLSLEQNMMFQSKLYKVPKSEAKQRMDHLIKCFALESYMKYPVSTYSGGVKRRLDIALNMMSNPKIIFLDEPTVGMDIQSRMAMWKMMKQLKEYFGTTIFLTTHYLEEADQLSDTICIMKDGKEVIQGTALELRTYLNQERLEIKFKDAFQAKRTFHLIQKKYGFLDENLQEERIVIRNSNYNCTQMHEINRVLLEQNIDFRGIEIIQPSLEDVFIQFTKETKEAI